MTRYARTKGQKRKVEEEPTPWNELKVKPNSRLKENGKQSVNDSRRVKSDEMSKPIKHAVASKNVRIKKFKNKASNSSKKTTNRMISTINWNMDNLNSVELSDTENNTDENKKLYKRRKPIVEIPPIFVNGDETRIARFEGFPVKKDDAERLKDLKRKLISMKVSRSELIATLKAERRRAEKALARERKKICFHCRHSGHVLSQCPQLVNISDSIDRNALGICFKCGSTEHQHGQCKAVRDDNYKFAVCFICKEEGHISKQCPDNPRGLYPNGGACRMCGDVTHLKKDCPQFVRKKQGEFSITADVINNRTPDALEEDVNECETKKKSEKKRKIIKIDK